MRVLEMRDGHAIVAMTVREDMVNGQELTATARLRSKRGRSGIYDVEVRSETGVVAEFRGHSRRVRQGTEHA